MFKNLIALFIATAFLTGCSYTKPEPLQSVSQLKGKRIATKTQASKSYEANNVGQQLLGDFSNWLAGPTAPVQSSNSSALARKHGIKDPAINFLSSLSKEISKNHGAYITTPKPDSFYNYPDEVSFADKHNSDIILSASTSRFKSDFYNIDPRKYHTKVSLYTIMRNGKNGAIMFSHRCNYATPYKNSLEAPNWDTLFANNAQAVKDIADKATSFCVQDTMNALNN